MAHITHRRQHKAKRRATECAAAAVSIWFAKPKGMNISYMEIKREIEKLSSHVFVVPESAKLKLIYPRTVSRIGVIA